MVSSVETLSRHRGLYHYTNLTAFEGIVRSQTLWCSHYSDMLDTDEVNLMRTLLVTAVAPGLDALDPIAGWRALAMNRASARAN